MNKTYIHALVSTSALAILHFFASDGHWYVRYPGFDILMHILGGLALAFSIFWIIKTFLPKYEPNFWSLIVLTLALGFAWEAMETMYDIAGAPVGTTKYYWDSAKDLVNDMLGAIIAAFLLKK